MAEEGIKIPFSVEADGVEVTIEKLAASVLELSEKMDKLTEAQKRGQGISAKQAIVLGAVAGAASKATEKILGMIPSLSDFTRGMSEATAFGEKFQNMSLQFNTSAEALQKLAAVGKPFGVSVDQMARSLNLLDRNLGKMGPTFKKFGIDAKAIAGQDSVQRFQTIAQAIGKIEDPAKQAAASFELLKDRSGAFLKIIRDQPGVGKAVEEFDKFGLAVSNNAVGALESLGDKKEVLESIGDAIKRNFFGAIAQSGALQKAIDLVVEGFGMLSKWVQDNQATITAWTNTIVNGAAAVLVGLASTIIPKVIDAFTGFKLIIFGLQAAFEELGNVAIFVFDTLANPTDIKKNWDVLKQSSTDTLERLKEKTKDAMDQNAEFQAKGQEVVNFLQSMADKVALAASGQTDFAAKLKETGDQAGLTAEEMVAVEKAAKSMNESIADMTRGLREQAIVLQEQADGLSAVEIQANKLSRDADEQIRKLEESAKKAFTVNDKFLGIPPEVRKNLDEVERKIRFISNAQQAKLIDDNNLKIANEALKRVTDQQKALFGGIKNTSSVGVDVLETELEDRLHVIGQAFLEQFGQSIEQIDFSKLDPKSLAAVTDLFASMDADAKRAGITIDGLIDKLKKARAAQLEQAGDPELQGKLLKERADALKQEEAVTKTLRSTQRDILNQMVKNKEITQEQADKLLPKAVSNSELFRDALEVAAQAAQLLGDTFGGEVLGGMLAAAAAGEQVAESIRKAKESGEGMGKALIGAAGAALSVATNIAKANSQELSGAKAAASGAAQGASFGAQVGGPWGAVIGGIGGALIGFFSGSKFRKIAKDAGKVLGDGLSKETIQAIQDDMKRLDLSAASASLLHIGDAMRDTNKSAHDFAGQMNDLLKGIADGTIPAKEGIEALDEGFQGLAEEAEKAGTVGDRALVGLIKNARSLGQLTPQMKAFVSEQLDAALEGVHKFVNAVKGLSDEAIGKLGKDSGVVFGAMFEALVSERGIVAAVDALKEDFDGLRETLMKSLGEEAVNTILGPFGAAFATLGDEKLRPIFDGIDGLTQAMKGLANAGFLTTDQFTAMQDATATLFDEAIAGGADMKTALLAVAPGIQAAISAAEQFGVPLDEDTQRLKDLAEQNGITFKTDPQQQMLDVLVSIAEVMGAKIPESITKMRNSMIEGTGASTSAAQTSAETISGSMGGAIDTVNQKWIELRGGGEEAFMAVDEGATALADSLALDVPEAAQRALDSLKQVQEAAAQGISVGGGGATGGTGGIKTVSANVSVNLGINENPLAAADTAAAMRRATVEWTAEAIEDRIPSIISAVEANT